MQWWGAFIRFFNFSHREIWGVKVLFCLIVAGFFLPALLRYFAPAVPAVPAAVKAELEAYMAARSLQNAERDDKVDEGANAMGEEVPIEYFSFDPNTLNQEGWMRLGFSERQASMIVNYRAKGGRFYRKEDLQKIYAIDEADYQRIAPYIAIAAGRDERSASVSAQASQRNQVDQSEDKGGSRSSWTPVERPEIELMIELNTADSIRLQLLPGIGPAFASRIVRYRDRLGGFHALDQLLDVYGMDAQRIAKLTPHVWIDPAQAKGLRINEADLETVGRHPLIGFKLAGILLRYRDHHGAFEGIEDIRELAIFDEEQLAKLTPYLLF